MCVQYKIVEKNVIVGHICIFDLELEVDLEFDLELEESIMLKFVVTSKKDKKNTQKTRVRTAGVLFSLSPHLFSNPGWPSSLTIWFLRSKL